MICCPSSIKGCQARSTKLDDCGVPLDATEPNSRVMAKAFTEITFSPDVQEGETIEIYNFKGDLCIFDKDCAKLKGWNVTIGVCTLNFPLLSHFGNMSPLFQGGANIQGGVVPGPNGMCDLHNQLEIWTKNAVPTCPDPDDPDSVAKPWVHWVMPKLKNFMYTDTLNFANNSAQMFKFTAYAEANPNFQPSTAGDWDPDDVVTIQGAGAIAYQCAETIPTIVDECAFVPAA